MIMRYLKNSFQKFKNDALSKVFYDSLKWVVIAFIGFIITGLLPINEINVFFQKPIRLSVYNFILISLLLVLSTVILVSIFYYGRYKKFKEQSQIDELTGLKNHKALEEYLMERLQYYNKNGGNLSIILLDIDVFKGFNTKHGYNTADKILGKVGELLARDKRATDETFRKFLRGDEFLVVTNDTCLANAIQAADRKRNLIANTSFIIDHKSYNLTVSCGVTEFKIGLDNFESLTDRVAKALVEAKQMPGKNSTKSNI